MSTGSARLPAGRQFAVTWALERDFGGMTTAMLRRSRSFAEAAGTPVEVLTFDPRDDLDRLVGELRSAGRLPDSILVRNLWDDLADGRDPGAAPAGAKTSALAGFSPLPAAERTPVRRAPDGSVLQVDRRRPDGTLAVSDRRDTRVAGTIGGRSIVVCDRTGQPAFGFTRARPFYHWWLDTVLGEDDSFLLVDSKTAAGIIVDYRSPHATRIHVLHNSHLDTETRPWGPLKPTRIDVLPRLDDFDATVVLSERQRHDLTLLLGASDAVEVVPNAADLPASAPPGPRDPHRGVLVGSLIDRKRVDDAIRAIALARGSGADVRLDVYGDGELRAELESLVVELGVTETVRLRGFDPSAVDEFGAASFFLLTSRSEGFPLVLAEGMSRGCIPLSYDIPYGPADMIEDGSSGFLVPPGDVGALAERIVAVSAGVPQGMREAAAQRASLFTEKAVLDRWAGVLERARTRHLQPAPSFQAEVRAWNLKRRGGSFTAWADFTLKGVDVSPAQVSPGITLRGPGTVVLRAVGSVRRTLRHGTWRASIEFPARAGEWLPPDVAFSCELELRIGGRSTRIALAPGSKP